MLPKLILCGLAIGLLSGAIAALCGVGGGLVMVPFFTLALGLGQKQAVATSLAVIVPTALIASYKNAQNDFINWPLFLATALGATAAAYFMADKLKSLQDVTLTKIFAGTTILMGILLWAKADKDAAKPVPNPSQEQPKAP
jgi:uncharacterized protein